MTSASHSSAPQFSIIIPAFNAAATIAAAIESVLAQTFTDYEIIVVDDGSTDDTRRMLEPFARQIVVINQANRGLSGARNSGARTARGGWLALLDADDTWTAEKLAAIDRRICADSAAVMIYSDATCFDETARVERGPFMPPELAHAPTMGEMMAGRFQILPSSAVIRRDAYTKSGGFSEEFRGASGFEDVYFWLLLREQGPFAYVPERLVNYRVAPLEARLERYRPGFELFVRLVRARYGKAGAQLIAARRRARVTRWAQIGLVAMRHGDSTKARWALRHALYEDPWRLKTMLRFLRTYLPRNLARALSGKSRDRLTIG